ncbi:MAG: TrbC/VirB2 family protein [Alphaproteobacteria bacterium]|nr:TrbC/VirB2 family protein [Alphaproteobacteria bacterium]
MLCNSIKRFLYENRYAIILFVSLFFFITDASAETFGALSTAGTAIFQGLRKIIYPAATIGIACVCIGGMFGSFNWKWLVAILLGVFIIATANSGNGVDAIAMDGSN